MQNAGSSVVACAVGWLTLRVTRCAPRVDASRSKAFAFAGLTEAEFGVQPVRLADARRRSGATGETRRAKAAGDVGVATCGGRGYFVCSSANVTDDTIAEYIGLQGGEPQNGDRFQGGE